MNLLLPPRFLVLLDARQRRCSRILIINTDFVSRDPKTKAKKYKYPAFYDPYRPRPPHLHKIVQLVEKIASLPLEEYLQISPALRDKVMHPKLQPIAIEEVDFGTEQAGSSQRLMRKKVKKTTFNVKLGKFDGGVKLKIIKEIRSFTDLGLKEAKDLVEKAPVILRQQVSKDGANIIIDKIKAVRGVAVME